MKYVTLVDPTSGHSWRVPKNRLDPWHTVTVNFDGWHMAHPITCDLDRCEFNAEAMLWTHVPVPAGTYQWSHPDEDPLLWRQIGDDDEM